MPDYWPCEIRNMLSRKSWKFHDKTSQNWLWKTDGHIPNVSTQPAAIVPVMEKAMARTYTQG